MLYLFSLFFLMLYFSCLTFFVSSFFSGGLMLDLQLFSLGGIEFSFCLLFDFISAGFFSCVSFISGMVFLYSVFYMGGTVDLRRFSSVVFLFVVSMFFLVFSGNFFMTMLGWDGLGLVSFFLVIFYSNSMSLDSGLITVFSNRVGDVFFLFSFYFFSLSGWWTSDSESAHFLLFAIVLFSGAVTKSAQVPFSSWLPAAMAAPTPVSSLVHSSTLVTAGIYVLIRFNYVFYFLELTFFKVISLFTMVLAGFCACVEKDFKKVVAMSTLSQLGMMLFVLSTGLWLLSFLHMVIHAFFKSLLFLSAGSLMSHGLGYQDSRFYGSNSFSYVAYVYFLVSCFCLGGFPFLIGFYSKDFIISQSLLNNGSHYFVFFLGGCMFTVVYSLRLIWSSYARCYNFFCQVSISEAENFLFPSFLLFMKSWVLGGLFHWFFLSEMSFFFSAVDLLLGIVVMVLGSLLFYFLKLFYSLGNYLVSISFLRWGSISMNAIFNKSLTYPSYDSSWLELAGGKGSFYFLNKSNFFFSKVMLISTGSFLFSLFILSGYLF